MSNQERGAQIQQDIDRFGRPTAENSAWLLAQLAAARSTLQRQQNEIAAKNVELDAWWDFRNRVYAEAQAAREREAALREALIALHAATDEANAEHGLMGCLCLLCHAPNYDARVGIVHKADCALLSARAALAPQPTSEAP